MTETPLRRNRDFVLLQAGQLLSTFGSGMSSVAYPLLTLAVTHSASRAGYVGAAVFVPLVLVALPAGVAADRYDRRRLMIAADAVGAAAVGALAVVVALGAVSFWSILAAAFVDSTAGVVFRTAQSGAFRAVVPRSQLAAAASAAQARSATVRLAAPPAGGALFGVARSVPFLADACSYAFSTLSLLAMRTRFQEERADHAERPRVREGIAYFARMPFLRATIGMIAVSNFTFTALQLTLIVVARRQGLSGAAVGGSSRSSALRRSPARSSRRCSAGRSRCARSCFRSSGRRSPTPRSSRARACTSSPARSPSRRSASRTPTRRSPRTRTRSSPTGCSVGRWRPRTRSGRPRHRSVRWRPACC